MREESWGDGGGGGLAVLDQRGFGAPGVEQDVAEAGPTGEIGALSEHGVGGEFVARAVEHHPGFGELAAHQLQLGEVGAPAGDEGGGVAVGAHIRDRLECVPAGAHEVEHPGDRGGALLLAQVDDHRAHLRVGQRGLLGRGEEGHRRVHLREGQERLVLQRVGEERSLRGREGLGLGHPPEHLVAPGDALLKPDGGTVLGAPGHDVVDVLVGDRVLPAVAATEGARRADEEPRPLRERHHAGGADRRAGE